MAKCANCDGPYNHKHEIVRDPLYHGPNGHARQDWCLDCWYDGDRASAMAVNPGEWDRRNEYLWHRRCGCTQADAASLAGCGERTGQEWECRIRKKIDEIPDWLAENTPSRVPTSRGQCARLRNATTAGAVV